MDEDISDDVGRVTPAQGALLEAPSRPAEAENVVEFKRPEVGDAERLDTLRRAPSATCTHRRQRLVDEKQRTVQCGECGAWLDPIWCLLTLVEYRESLARERRAIEAEKRHAHERQQRAIERLQRLSKTQKAEIVARNCRACEGTGFRRASWHKDGQIVTGRVRCECRKSGARLIE